MSYPARSSRTSMFSARILAASLALALAACGGGGGGSSGGGSVTPTTFTSWGALPASTPVNINGMSVTRTSGGAVSTDTAASRAGVIYNARTSGGLRGFTFTTPATSASWTISSGSSLSCAGGLCALANSGQTVIGAISDPYHATNAWSYQSFGAWSIPSGAGSAISAMSFGAPTAGAALPVAGTATYTGSVVGRYVAAAGDFIGVPAGTQFGMGASLQADVNFATRQIGLSTSGTALLRQGDTPPPFGDVRFDILNPAQATLTYAPGTNSFSGTVAASSNALGLNGQMNGRFYGPGGQELGGTMSLNTAAGGALTSIFARRGAGRRGGA